MTEAELNKLLARAYRLGVRVFMHANGISMKAIEDKSDDLLQEIAEGETTIISGAAELIQNTPIAPERVEDMREYVNRNANKLVQRDREMAQRIIDGMG